jgi:hypothetical protein
MKKLLLLLCLCATFAQAQNADQNNIQNTISRYKAALLLRSVDTFWVYSPAWGSGPPVLMVAVGDTSCSIAGIKYLYWQEKGEFYRQRFESCVAQKKDCWTNVLPVVKIQKSAFSKTLNAAFATIKTDKMQAPEYDLGNNESSMMDFDDDFWYSFEFHLKDSIYKKSFSAEYISEEHKYYKDFIKDKDTTIINKYYYPNQNTILYKLMDWDLSATHPTTALLARGVDTFWVYSNHRCETQYPNDNRNISITNQLYFIEKGVFYRQSFEYYGEVYEKDNIKNISPAKAVKPSELSEEIKKRLSEMMTAEISHNVDLNSAPYSPEDYCDYDFEFYIKGKTHRTSFYRTYITRDTNKENVRKNENSILLKLVEWDRLNAKND